MHLSRQWRWKMIRQDLNSSCRVLCTNTWRRLRPSLGGPTIWKLIDMCWQNIMKRDLECFPHSQAAGCNAFRLRSSNMFKLRVCATLQNMIVSVILCVCVYAHLIFDTGEDLNGSPAHTRHGHTPYLYMTTWSNLKASWKGVWLLPIWHVSKVNVTEHSVAGATQSWLITLSNS